MAYRRCRRFGGREIAVRHALCEDGLGHGAVQRQTFGLPVLLVPAEIEPAQTFENRIERGFGVALDIGIVDAQDHRPAVVAGIKPIEDISARAPDVQKAGGRRRKPDSQH